MADSKRVSETGSGLGAVSEILNLFGNQTKQTSTADTSGLKTLLGQLQGGQDPTALLQSIFQQAAGQIPGLQAAFANSVGARSGGNSSVNAALQKLLQQTTLAGQQQISQQQQQNQNLQANVAGKIADSTRTVTGSQSPNLGAAGKGLAIMQLLGKSGATDKIRGLFTGGAGAAGGAGSGVTGATLDFGGTPSFDFGTELSSTPFQDYASTLGSGAVTQAASSDDIYSAGADLLSGAGDLLNDAGNSIVDWFSGGFGLNKGGVVPEVPHYADGGIVRSGGGRRSSAPTFQRDPIMRTLAINPQEGKRGRTFGGGGGGSEFGGYSGNLRSGSIAPGSDDGAGSGSTSTGLPNWLVGLIGNVVGGPILGQALKLGNSYLEKIDPTNPSGPNAVNGSDFESDQNMANNQLRNLVNQLLKDSEKEDAPNGEADLGTGNYGREIGGSSGFDPFSSFGGGLGGYGGSSGGGGGIPNTEGTPILDRNKGGGVPGPKVDADVVPAMLTPGEFVIRKDVVDAMGADFFHALNQLGMKKGT